MSYPATTVIQTAQAFLNDARGQTYTFDKILPYLRIAYDDLQERLQLSESPAVMEHAGPMTVVANATELNPQPDDIILPLYMEERAPGEDDSSWVPMNPKRWEVNMVPGATLDFWTWRGGKIVFRGASVIREVQLQYLKGFPTLETQKADILVHNAKNFIGARTAELVERYVKHNFRKADSLATDAESSMERVLKIATKGEQAMPVRRLPFGTSRRLRRIISR